MLGLLLRLRSSANPSYIPPSTPGGLLAINGSTIAINGSSISFTAS